MTDRVSAGRLAQGRGQRAEHECTRFMREKCNRTVHRVKRGPYDLVGWDEIEHFVAQVKSYLLLPSELRQAEEELMSVIAPPGTVREVWMKNRKRGHRKRVDTREWVAKIVGKDDEW